MLSLPCLVLNSGHYMRTYKTFGTPLPVDTMRATNEIINFQSISSNIIRNISLNLTVPSKKINDITINFVENVHSLIKIKTNDKRTTFTPYFYLTFTFMFILLLFLFYVYFHFDFIFILIII